MFIPRKHWEEMERRVSKLEGEVFLKQHLTPFPTPSEYLEMLDRKPLCKTKKKKHHKKN